MKEKEPASGTELKQVETDSRGRVTLGSEYADQEFEIAVEDVQDIEDKDAYFHRMGLDVTDRGRLDIFMQRRIAIDWDVGGMTNPWVFEKVAEKRGREREDRTGKGVRADARNLYRLSHEGGIVAAHFGSSVFRSHSFTNKVDGDAEVMLIGEVEPGTEIEPMEYTSKSGQSKYINTLRMVNSIDVHKCEEPKLFENFPRGTIRKWDVKEDLVKELYLEKLEDRERYYKGEYE